MNPLALARLAVALGSTLVTVADKPEGGVRVRVLGVPVYDSEWAGVKRRQARRAARAEERALRKRAGL